MEVTNVPVLLNLSLWFSFPLIFCFGTLLCLATYIYSVSYGHLANQHTLDQMVRVTMEITQL